MADDDADIRDALRELAHRLPVTTPEPPEIETTRAWGGTPLVAASILAVALVAGSLVVGHAPANRVHLDPSTTSVPPPVTTSTVLTGTAGRTPSSGAAPTTAQTIALTRPVLDLPGCVQAWARTGTRTTPYAPFGRSGSRGVPVVQVFASASGSIADPYVVVERFFVDQEQGLPVASTDADGSRHVVTLMGGAGVGVAHALLPDGSELYVRDRGFDEATLRTIAKALVARQASSPVPGFDLPNNEAHGLGLLDETTRIDNVPATSSTFGCTQTQHHPLYVDVVRAAPVYQFTTFVDQPAPLPIATMLPDGAVLIVKGLEAPQEAAVILGSVRQATEVEWQALLQMTSPDQHPIPGRAPELPGVVPAHGIAYTTPDGLTVADLDGTVVFQLTGWRIENRSPDTSTTAAISLDGWAADGSSPECLHDARRAGSPVLLCIEAGDKLPRTIARRQADGTARRVASSPPTVPPGTGHWVEAIEGPGEAIAATWSGDCESLVAYRIAPDGAITKLVDAESAVLGWIDQDILIARFGGCGPASTDDGLYRVSPSGMAIRIPTPGAAGPPVAW